MKKRGRNKKAEGAISMSFGTIFSIIIIIFILVVGFIVIKWFFDTGDCYKVGVFINDLQKDVDNTWRGGRTEGFSFEANLPSNLEYVCFADFETASPGDVSRAIYEDIQFYEGEGGNMFLYPAINSCENPSTNLQHIDLEKILEDKNPYCIPINNGKISIEIKKPRGSPLVELS